MGSFSMIARQIKTQVDATLSPAILSAHLASRALSELNAVIKSGEAPDYYDKFVDGRKGVPESSVKPDGIIVYRFNWLAPCLEYGLNYVKKRSPVDSGTFQDSWLAIVNGSICPPDSFKDIPLDAEVMITNFQPYARKIEVGAMKTISASKGILTSTRSALRRRFRNLEITRAFITIPPGLIEGVPYVLKKRKTVRNRKTKQITQVQQTMTYPALIITRRI
ncbi:hypothetical protein [Aristophania vespae]|uniref:hypothetical protein n=1 Tax=Aristophania vespae TaxID=2697033 RepID=UPI002351B257|nr:hypothetical protein [Aristophania vespae]UMM63096.1 hypothetical protein DM15PD_00500 [Aristophania vespae]